MSTMEIFSKRLVQAKSGKKITLCVDGNRVQMIRQTAELGAPSTSEVVELSTPEAAMLTATRFIAAQLEKGYLEAVDVPLPGRLATALESVRAGATPAVALATLCRTGTAEEIAAFVDKEAKGLFGMLAEHLVVDILDLQWRDGFVDAATLTSHEDLAVLTRQFLALPLCSRVRRLRFGVPGHTKHTALQDWTRTFAAVTAAPCAATLESLGFDFMLDDDTPPLDTIVIGDLSRGWEALTVLRELSVRGQRMTLAGAELPTVETLRWECADLGARKGADLHQLATAKLPRLTHLALPGPPLKEAVGKRLLGMLDAFPALQRIEADLSALRPDTQVALRGLRAKPAKSKSKPH